MCSTHSQEYRIDSLKFKTDYDNGVTLTAPVIMRKLGRRECRQEDRQYGGIKGGSEVIRINFKCLMDILQMPNECYQTSSKLAMRKQPLFQKNTKKNTPPSCIFGYQWQSYVNYPV